MSGKFNSYEHPLKLNLFFIFVFFTLFALLNNRIFLSISDKTSKGTPIFIIYAIEDENNEELYVKIKESEKDTIKLETSTKLISLYSDFIIPIDSVKANVNDTYHTYLCIVPTLFIDEHILKADNNGTYSFIDHEDQLSEYMYDIVFEQSMINNNKILWIKTFHFLASYFPLIFLLTTPIFAMAVNLMNIKKKIKKTWTYVFSLHYTAFVSLLILIIFIILMIAGYNTNLLWVLPVITTPYLTIAIKNVYDKDSWIKSFIKGIAINILYIIIASIALFIIMILMVILYQDEFNLNV